MHDHPRRSGPLGALPPDATRLRWISGTAALMCIVVGVLGLTGWALDMTARRGVGAGFDSIGGGSALLFVVCGGLLWHVRHRDASPHGRARGALLVASALLLVVTVAQLGATLDFSRLDIGRVLLKTTVAKCGGHAPLCRAPSTEIAFAASAVALLLLLQSPDSRRRRRHSYIEGAAAVVTAIGGTVVLGYAIGVESGAQASPVTGGALYAGAMFLILGIGLFAAAWQRQERTRWAIGPRVTTSLAAALAVIVLLMASAYRSTRDMQGDAWRIANSLEVRYRAGQVLSSVQALERAQRAFARAEHDSTLARLDSASLDVAAAMRELRSAAGPPHPPAPRVATIDSLVNARLDADALRAELTALDADEARTEAAARGAATASARRAYLLLPLTGLFSLAVLPLLFLALNREAGAHREAAESARLSEADFRAAFEHSAIGISVAAPDGRFLRVNQRLCDILGEERATLEQRSFQDFSRAEDRTADKRMVDELRRGDIADCTLERCFRRADGAAIWVNLTISLVRREDGAPLYFIAAVEDISDRKQLTAQLALSEERFRVAASASSDSIWDWELHTDRIWRSVDLQRRFGYIEVDGSDSLTWWMARVHADDRGRLEHELSEALASPSGAWESEYRFQLADGSFATLHDKGIVLRAPDGTPERMLGSSTNITERVAMDAKLRHAEKMETVGMLAGGIAHDFNNHLAVILGAAEMAAFDLPTDAPAADDLALIRDTAARAAELTRQLLSFSRKRALEPKLIALNDIVAGTEPMLRRLIGTEVAIVIEADPDAGATLIDPVQLQQVLLNLAVNGRDAMPRGGTLTIATGNAELDEAYVAIHEGARPGPHVVLTVSDDGDGMDAETRKHIFDAFFTTKEAGRGTGLGLATVHGIVKQSGGEIWVYSEPGRGTTFKVYFPRATPTSDPVSMVPAKATPIGAARLALVVDDEPLLRHMTSRMLDQLGFRALTAVSGMDALDVLARHDAPPHLVLTDVFMPGMNGPDVARCLRERYPSVKILFTSGLSDDMLQTDGSLAEGAPFIPKPFSLASLSQKLQEVLAD